MKIERKHLMSFNQNLNINSSNTTNSIYEKSMLLLLFLAAVNFFGGFGYFLFLSFFIFVITPNRCFRFNMSFLLLSFFSLFQLVFNVSVQSSPYNMILALIYPISYLMGHSFCSAKDSLDKHNKCVYKIIYVTSFGTLVHFLLNWYKNSSSVNSGVTERNTIDFWSNEVMSATGQAALACFSLCVISAFLFSSVGKKEKIFSIIILGAIIAYNFILAGRTIIAMLLILVVFSIFFRMKVYKKGNIKIIIIVALVLLAILLMYTNDVFGMKSFFEQSNLYDRFNGKYSQDVDDDSRLEHKLDYLKYIEQFPFGGNNIRGILGFSAHDLYLDTYDESGIFATFTIIAFIISSIIRAVKCVKNKTIPVDTKHLLACVYLGVNIQFWLEPIMRGMPWLLAFYCLIDGAVTAMLDKTSQKQ